MTRRISERELFDAGREERCSELSLERIRRKVVEHHRERAADAGLLRGSPEVPRFGAPVESRVAYGAPREGSGNRTMGTIGGLALAAAAVLLGWYLGGGASTPLDVRPEAQVISAGGAESHPRSAPPQEDTERPATAPSVPSALVRPAASGAPAPRSSGAAPPGRVANLEEELEHLGRVRRTLDAGNSAVALALLDDYRTRLGGRQLSDEAELLTIQALRDGGHSEEAQLRARRFIGTRPGSPLVDRMRTYAGAEHGTSPADAPLGGRGVTGPGSVGDASRLMSPHPLRQAHSESRDIE
jgi:hypothetical protein